MPAAMDAASGTMGRVLAALERTGVERKDVQSTGLSVDPVYEYFDYRPPVLTGYRVNQSVSVLVRDLRDGGQAISTATGTGGNAVRVSGIGLRIGDRDGLLAEARDAAVEAATAKAEQYAAATGQDLGTVLTLTEGARPSLRRATRCEAPTTRRGARQPGREQGGADPGRSRGARGQRVHRWLAAAVPRPAHGASAAPYRP